MNYIKKSLLALSLTSALIASAQQINPITRAMLNGYTELLRENPKDYQTLYERAAQYYRLSQYDDASNDLIKAIEYTPAKEKDLRLSEFTLMADVAIETHNYELALKSVNDALEIDPQNYANIYKKGNILLHLNRPDEAYKTFSSMQTLRSRSQEAYFGMAKACILKGDFSEAEDLMKEAENADPSSYLTYCRLGDLYLDMNQPENAATNYLLGFNLSDNSRRPLESLIDLADKNYNAVAAALDFAISKTDAPLPTLFLKGNIACESGNFGQAVEAFDRLLGFPEGQTAGVYYQAAKSKLGMNDLIGANEYINKALTLELNPEYYLIKSKIELAEGKSANALTNAENALRISADFTEALITKAEAQIASSDPKGAVNTLNEAIMIAPDNMKALLLRAYVNESLNNDAKAAVGDYNRIIMEDAEDFPAVVIKGIAQSKAGKRIDADATIQDATSSKPEDKDALYWIAVYYAQTGNLEKGKEFLDRAQYAGFQNLYDLRSASTPWLTIAPLRHLLK